MRRTHVRFRITGPIQRIARGLALGLFFLGAAGQCDTFTVDDPGNDADLSPDGSCDTGSGVCTLRAAIQEANATAGADRIHFALPGTLVIELPSASPPLPPLESDLVIDGSTQPNGDRVVLDGSLADPGVSGLTLEGSNIAVSGLTVRDFPDNGIVLVNAAANLIGGDLGIRRNILIGNGGAGLRIEGGGSTGNQVEGNYVGLDGSGGAAPNGVGIHLFQAGANTIGKGRGPGLGSGNLISGNDGAGLVCEQSSGSEIQGNFIGLGPDGDTPVPNGGGGFAPGIHLTACSHLVVGGRAPGQGNLISGNVGPGVWLEAGSSHNEIAGNRIGTDLTGLVGRANAGGIRVTDSPFNNLFNNLVAGNNGPGIDISGAADGCWIQGNQVGTDISGDNALPNQIGISLYSAYTLVGGISTGLANLISGNDGPGIALFGPDAHDNDIQSNHIGVRRSGGALPNTDHGIAFSGGAAGNQVGGIPEHANHIAYNAGAGVSVQEGEGNLVRGNLIHDNTGGGILLGPGGNGNPSSPTLTGPGGTAGIGAEPFEFSLDVHYTGTPGTDYEITFYRSAACATPQGGEYLGTITEQADAGGVIDGPFVLVPSRVATGEFVTATATDPDGNTSAFSDCLSVIASAAKVLPPVEPMPVPPPALAPAGPPPEDMLVVDDTGDGGDFIAGDNQCADFNGHCTLRAAIQVANEAPDTQRIEFAFPAATLATIAPLTDLPTVTQPLVIDGTSHPGYDGSPMVELDGINVLMGNHGLDIQAGRSAVTGLAVHRFPAAGIHLGGSGGNTLAANFVGTDPGGDTDQGNASHGIWVEDTDGNAVGLPGEGNLVSGNGGFGIYLSGAGAVRNQVLGNLVGSDAAGTLPLGNDQYGIGLDAGASVNRVGGSATDERNLVSANAPGGILVWGATTRGNQIRGNYIGTDLNGSAGLGIALEGILIEAGASDTLVGGTDDADNPTVTGGGNLVAGHQGDGIHLKDTDTRRNRIAANHVGLDVSGNAPLPNGGNGIHIEGEASFNLVGGSRNAGEGNLIGGNGGAGLLTEGAGTTGQRLFGNYIGTNPGGASGLGNAQQGILIRDGATSDQLGWMPDLAGYRNTVAGNNDAGILLTGSGTAGHHVSANFVGNLDGYAARPNTGDGVRFQAGANDNRVGNPYYDAVNNLISGNGGDGMSVSGAGSDYNQAIGNRIGTTWDGHSALPNGGNGISYLAGASFGFVGGNLVSGNTGHGVFIDGAGSAYNEVFYNQVGTNGGQTGALPNGGSGVVVSGGAADNRVGAPDFELYNVICANGGYGVLLDGINTSGNWIQGNYIGTDVTEALALGNGEAGVGIDNDASDNRIGGTGVGEGNRIRHNRAGVEVTSGTGNSILGNLIAANTGLGIDLADTGGLGTVNANDTLDADGGANFRQNFPLVASATTDTAGTATVEVTLDSAAGTAYQLQLFTNGSCDASGNGEGEQPLITFALATDGTGHGHSTLTLFSGVTPPTYLTATATDPNGNTSEFSPCFYLTGSSGGGGGYVGGGPGPTIPSTPGTTGDDPGGDDPGGDEPSVEDPDPTPDPDVPDPETPPSPLHTPVPGSPPHGLVGLVYYLPLPVEGGTPPYDYAVTGGELPPGLRLEDGSIRGVPSGSGGFDLTLSVRDAADPANTLEIVLHLTIAADTPIPRGQSPDLAPDPAAPPSSVERSAGGPGEGHPDEAVEDSAGDAFGNRYVVGYSYRAGSYDLTLVKLDAAANPVWQRSFGDDRHARGFGVAIHPYDQSAYAVGWELAGLAYRGVIYRIAPDGGLLWQRGYAEGGRTDALYGVVTDFEALYVVGESYNGHDFDALVLKYDHAGNLLWQARYATDGNDTAYAPLLLEDAGGTTRLFVGGGSGNGTRGGWLAQFDPADGTLLGVAGITPDTPVEALAGHGDRLYAGGTTPADDWWLGALTPDLVLLWEQVPARPGEDVLHALGLDHEGWLYAAGRHDGDATLRLFAPDGAALQEWRFDRGDTESGHGLGFSPDGHLYLVGDEQGEGGTRLFEVEVDNGKAF